MICLQKGEYDLPPNVHVYSLGKESGENRMKYLVRFYWFFGRVFFRVRVDFVFFHMGAIYNILAAPFFVSRKLFGTKFLWWKAHGHINKTGRLALVFVDEVLTSTASGFPIETKKRRIVGQAIDTNIFHLPEQENRGFSVVYVGRVSKIKRLDLFMETAELMAEDEYEFSIIGPLDNTDYLNKLKSLDKKGRVKFLGPKTQLELVKIYQHTRLFLNTSKTHSMDKTVLEAILSGCLPITSNLAFKNLLGSAGLYIEKANVEDYREAIQKFMHTNTTELVDDLREKAIVEHSLSTFTKRIFWPYEKI